MKLNFSKWYTYLLVFAPILALLLFQIISEFAEVPYGISFGIICLLILLGLFVCYLTQFYIGVSYFKATGQNKYIFVGIGLVALLFILLAIYATIYGWSGYEKMHRTRPISRGSQKADILLNAILALSLYTVITYSIVNNLLIRWSYKRLLPENKESYFKGKFLQPMKRVVRVSLLLYVIAIVVGLVQEIIRMQKI